MRLLIALPIQHPELASIDDVLNGTSPASGTVGSFIRLADYLSGAGFDVTLSGACEGLCTRFPYIKHEDVEVDDLDRLIMHQSHWNGKELSFGNEALANTVLWFQNQTSWKFTHLFLSKGGNRVVVPSLWHASIYRPLPKWLEKITVIYNSYCPGFVPLKLEPKRKLLFIGAITASKGFVELMQIWSYLVKKQTDLELLIAGSIGIHKDTSIELGPMGLADYSFEVNHIQPWLEKLPKSHQPNFLGALAPIQLRTEIAQSCAVIVNPSWKALEAFCVSAVDAQACNRTVFSIAAGGLRETVYQGGFDTLVQDRSIEAFGDKVIKCLSEVESVKKNGEDAGEFVRTKFNAQAILDSWIQMLSNRKVAPALPNTWESPRDLICDLLRWSRTGMFVDQHLRKH